ncbi:hypothetical protein M422DRAFT_37446 [Sphaerobolus stellatus SS14]|uniref:Uncharacterized protein n=1 Tax=Sphaerobolus stellatus (strain SS14) TaxID=990650 RepID=A0A0C9USE9_SPHS4|nr:hypothetical protein M422DRAFT_37446 [Sphaerobolus stellatus SS14]
MPMLDGEREMLRLWNYITEITEQVNQQKALLAKLQGGAGQIKDQAGRVSEAVTLRRFTADLSKEAFTCETERLAAALVMENQNLLHENKQLNELLKEYEQTLETVMGKFRAQSYAAHTHQATLVRHYETLLSREHNNLPMPTPLMVDPTHLNSLHTLVRAAMKALDGRDPVHDPDPPPSEAQSTGEESGAEGSGVASSSGVNNWAEEREIEIARLERENALLRESLFISGQTELEKEAGLSPGRTEAEWLSITGVHGQSHFSHSRSGSMSTPHFLRSPQSSTLGGGRGGGRAGLGAARRPGGGGGGTGGGLGSIFGNLNVGGQKRPGENDGRSGSPPPPVVDSI